MVIIVVTRPGYPTWMRRACGIKPPPPAPLPEPYTCRWKSTFGPVCPAPIRTSACDRCRGAHVGRPASTGRPPEQHRGAPTSMRTCCSECTLLWIVPRISKNTDNHSESVRTNWPPGNRTRIATVPAVTCCSGRRSGSVWRRKNWHAPAATDTLNAPTKTTTMATRMTVPKRRRYPFRDWRQSPQPAHPAWTSARSVRAKRVPGRRTAPAAAAVGLVSVAATTVTCDRNSAEPPVPSRRPLVSAVSVQRLRRRRQRAAKRRRRRSTAASGPPASWPSVPSASCSRRRSRKHVPTVTAMRRRVVVRNRRPAVKRRKAPATRA